MIQCEQGSKEWFDARVGVITASRFKDVRDKLKSGAPSAKCLAYAADVAIERISGQPRDGGFVTWQMRQGTEREPFARMAYEARTGNLALESGVALTDDRLFGYSTDGFIGEDGSLEIKSLSSSAAILAMWSTGDMSEYTDQMQGGMWLTGRSWCDFVMYVPELESAGTDLFIRRVERDEAYIEKLEQDLWWFNQMVEDYAKILRKAA